MKEKIESIMIIPTKMKTGKWVFLIYSSILNVDIYMPINVWISLSYKLFLKAVVVKMGEHYLESQHERFSQQSTQFA